MSLINEALKKAAQERGKEQEWLPKEFKPTQLKVDFSQKEILEEKLIGKRKMVSSSKKYWVLFFILGIVLACSIAYKNLEKKNIPGSESRISEDSKITLPVPAVLEEPAEKNVSGDQTVSNQTVSNIDLPVQAPHLENLPTIELTGIMMENPPRALVNGQFVMVGDKVNGVKILKIYSDHVVFRYQKKRFKRFIY